MGISISLYGLVALPSYARISWTSIPIKHVDDRDIYASSSTGNDTGSYGDSPGRGSIDYPFATLEYAAQFIRNTSGDRLWAKRGDAFVGDHFGTWTKTGISGIRPIIFGAYGTGARPTIDVENGTFFNFWNGANPSANHVWFDSLDFFSSTYSGTQGSNGIVALSGTNSACDGILIQNCRFSNMNTAIVIQGDGGPGAITRHSNVVIRGCVLQDMWAPGTSYAGGMYLQDIDNITVEFAHCDRVGVRDLSEWSNQKHCYYFHNTTLGVVFRYNLDTNSSDTQCRQGGDIHHNVRSQCLWNLQFGNGTEPQIMTATGNCDDNSMLSSGNAALAHICTGLRISNCNNGLFRRNYIIGSVSPQPVALWLHGADTHGITLAVTNTTISDTRIYNFGGLSMWSTNNGVNGVDWANITFERNYSHSPDNITYPFSGSAPYSVLQFRADTTGDQWNMADNKLRAHGDLNSEYSFEGSSISGISNGNWASFFGDSTTTSEEVTYSHPEGCTLGKYYTEVLGFADLGSESANHAAMIELMVNNERGPDDDYQWHDEYTAPAIRARLEVCMEVV